MSDEGQEHRQKAGGVQEEAVGHAHRADDHAPHRRSHHPGGVEQGGVEGDGVGQVRLAHQVHDEGLAHRDVKGHGRARQKDQGAEHPDLDHFDFHQHPQDQGQEHEDGLGDEEQPELGGVVGHHPAEEGKQEHRQGLERPHQAQIEGGVGEHQDQPAEGHGLHPGAGEGDHLAGVK